MKAPLMHLLVALVWLFLHGNATLGAFVLGMVAGFILLVVFQRALHCEKYIRRCCYGVIFLLRMVWEIFRANMRLTKLILSPKAPSIEGGFAYYDATELTRLEIILVSQCTSLMPGTTVADYNEKGQIVMHTYPALTDEELQKEIDETITRHLLAVTR